MTRLFATVNGVTIAYAAAGEGEPILFLHGAGGAPPQGASFVDMLARRHRILLPSRPGFDESPLGGCRTPQDAADSMAGFVDAVAKAPVHVVGQSAGAAVAAWLSVLHPSLVKSLVLSAPSTFGARPHQATPPTPQEIAKRLYGETPFWSAPPTAEDRARIQRNAAENMPRTHSPHNNRDLEDRLGEIAAPTLILVAGNDQIAPPDATVPFQKKIQNGHRIVIHGAAHELPISAAPRWTHLIADFIARGEVFVVNQGNHFPS